jgi:MoxR-like ATPase
MEEEKTKIQNFSLKIIENLGKVIIGKKNTLELVTIGLLGQGHILIDDVPGVGKTVLARSLAKTIGCDFKRIQFTPDMLPSDVTGISIYNQSTREFEFRPGPIVTQILLADEINRATPKTQSALLEAMEEKQVTVDGVTHQLSEPFLVLATQNPIEYEGTFPLPEAQLDRFFVHVQIGYPSLNDEIKILEAQQILHPINLLQAVTEPGEVIKMQEAVKRIHVAPAVKKYIVEVIRATRDHKEIYLGASPRGSLGLFRASQILAAISGRDYVIPDDVKYLAEFVLSHRIIVQPAARLKNITAVTVIEDVLQQTPVPGGKLNPEEN